MVLVKIFKSASNDFRWNVIKKNSFVLTLFYTISLKKQKQKHYNKIPETNIKFFHQSN